MWKKGKGFTLIELMVVIAIILILALIAIPAYRNMQDRAKRSRVQSDLRNLATILEVFYTDWNQYPEDTEGSRLIEGETSTPSTAGAELLGTGGSINVSPKISVTGETAPIKYIESPEKLPKDPFAPNADDSYYYQSDGQCWALWSENEISEDETEYIYRKSDGSGGTTKDFNDLTCP